MSNKNNIADFRQTPPPIRAVEERVWLGFADGKALPNCVRTAQGQDTARRLLRTANPGHETTFFLVVQVSK